MRFGGIFDLKSKQNRLLDIEQLSNEGEFWLDQKKAKVVLQEKAGLERLVGFFGKMDGACEDAGVLLEFALEGDEDSSREAQELLDTAERRCKDLETQRLLGEEGDDASAILEINSGAGQNHQTIMGASAIETNAAREEIFITLAMKSQVSATLPPICQASPNWVPRAVATPLPP
jgi:protein subunit release factor A